MGRRGMLSEEAHSCERDGDDLGSACSHVYRDSVLQRPLTSLNRGSIILQSHLNKSRPNNRLKSFLLPVKAFLSIQLILLLSS